VCCLIAGLGLAAVVATWWMGGILQSVDRLGARHYCHRAVGGHLFRKSGRRISCRFCHRDDMAVHALVLGKKPKAVFWVLCLPLCVIRFTTAGSPDGDGGDDSVALAAKIDWRLAIAGVALAGALQCLRDGATEEWLAEWKRMSKSAAAAAGRSFRRGCDQSAERLPFPRRRPKHGIMRWRS